MQHRFKFKVFALSLMAMLWGSQMALAKGTDTDGDGKFSKAEITAQRQAQLDKKFAKFDANQDGQLTMNEVKGKRGGVAKKADINKDGVITKDEARAHLSENIDKYVQKKDANGDGYLDKDERKRKASSGSNAGKKKAKKSNTNEAKSSLQFAVKSSTPFFVTGSFIFYCVEPKRNTYAQLFKYLQARRDESGIIYCLSRKTVDGLAADLRTDGLSALTYHAGLDKEFAREFESFPKDADSLYPSWREKSGVA